MGKVNSMILYSSPVFIVLWSRLLLGQKIHPLVLVCIGVSFIGLLLEVRPWSHSIAAPMWAYAISLIAAVLAGLAYVSLRMCKDVPYYTVMNVFLATCLLLSVIFGTVFGEVHPSAFTHWKPWPYLIGVAGFAYAAEVAVTCGF